MNMDLFHEWLKRFDLYVGRSQCRKILLLIDSCSAHGTPKTLPSLHNVRIEFLPPNTTSEVQVLDAGKRAWLKATYKRRLLFRFLKNIDMGRKSIYIVEILTAIRWTTEKWKNCSADVIKNCFSHCLIADFQITEEDIGTTVRETMASTTPDATEHNIENARVALENFLNHVDEDVVTEELSIKQLGREIGIVNGEEDQGLVTERVDAENSRAAHQELQHLAGARSIFRKAWGAKLC